MTAAVGADHPLDPSRALDPHHPRIADDVDAVRAMFRREIFRDTGRDHTVHDAVGHLQHCDIAVHPTAGRRRLQTDVTAADDYDPAVRLDSRLDRAHVLEPAK